MKFLKNFALAFVRACLSLRYRITVKGLEHLDVEKTILFLPNHPAEIDPVLIMLIVWSRFHPRPLIVDTFYFSKRSRFLFQRLKALPTPDMDQKVNGWKIKQVGKLYEQILTDLKRGDNFLIYPAGRLKLTGEEIVGGASLVHNLAQACPEANLVLIRTTGLWGSQFSRALTGTVPHFGKTVLNGIKILLKNGVFFAPRRHITVEISLAPRDFPRQADRVTFNRALERWYNRYPQSGAEPLKLVPYYFWKKELPKGIKNTKKTERTTHTVIAEDVKKAIVEKIAFLSRKPASQIDTGKRLAVDLGLDSLDLAQLGLFLEEQFQIAPIQPIELDTVGDVFQAAVGRKKSARKEIEFPVSRWPIESTRPKVAIPEGKTIQEVFLRCCDRMGTAVACGDDRFGIMTYRKFKMAALALSYQIKLFEGENVGVLLPSSVGAYIVILACMLAKKTPVMLNWTAGVRSLDHALKVCAFKHVVSSRRFLNALDSVDLGELDEQLCFLEDLKEGISWKQILKAAWQGHQKADVLLRALDLKQLSKETHAVILFTSGTESLPKGVPLSHNNLLSNQRSALSCIEMTEQDVFYGVLPPFHSFGFSVTGLLPLLAGLKVYYAPDPSDYFGIAQDLARWKVTLFCTAPSFLKGVLQAAVPRQLDEIRLFFTGAEKAPSELYESVAKLGKQLIEGYGITECSPIVTLRRLNTTKRGVGQPIPGVEVGVVDATASKLLPDGEEGEICICGPNVFEAYLGHPRNPFFQCAGKRWYLSGDRGYLDGDGTLVLTGRLKRFVKIGGEMVSLTGLEEEIMQLAQKKQWTLSTTAETGPALAISVREKEGEKPMIIVFTTMDLVLDEVNGALRESGYGRIVKIAEIRKCAQIPLTGTGKTHYRLLDDMV